MSLHQSDRTYVPITEESITVSNSRTIQIMPAIDWYYKHGQTVWPLAAFALKDNGTVVGLVGAGNDGTLKNVPPATDGTYVHRRQLTSDEIEAADKK